MHELATILYWTQIFFGAMGIINVLAGFGKLADGHNKAALIHIRYGIYYLGVSVACGAAALGILK